jgi:K319-like protein
MSVDMWNSEPLVVDSLIFFAKGRIPSATQPIANAGPNQAVTKGSTVTLDGTGSHATTNDVTIMSYSWVQTGGPAINFIGLIYRSYDM